MKTDIHPDYHDITVEMTNGETFQTRSTWGKKGDVFKLEVDCHSHNAWKKGGGAFVNKKAEKVAQFNKRYGNLGLASGAGAAEADQKQSD